MQSLSQLLQSKHFKTLAILNHILFVSIFAMYLVNNSHAGNPQQSAEAEILVKKAISYIQTNGTAYAYEEFNNGKTFNAQDLHITVYDLQGTTLANGENPQSVGANLFDSLENNEKPYVHHLVDLVKNKGKGWVSTHKSLNPTSHKYENQAIYLEEFNGTLVACTVHGEKH